MCAYQAVDTTTITRQRRYERQRSLATQSECVTSIQDGADNKWRIHTAHMEQHANKTAPTVYW